MSNQQEHLPREEPATSEQEWGFALSDFLNDTWPYLVAIVIVLVIFFYARYSWSKRNRK